MYGEESNNRKYVPLLFDQIEPDVVFCDDSYCQTIENLKKKSLGTYKIINLQSMGQVIEHSIADSDGNEEPQEDDLAMIISLYIICLELLLGY